MPKKPIARPQPNWLFIGVLAIIAAVIFYQPFLGSICVAVIIAVVLSPIYRWLSTRMHRKLASSITVVFSFAIILLPIGLVVTLAIVQGVAFAHSLTTLGSDPNSVLHSSTQPITDLVNRIFAPFDGGQPVVTQEQLQDIAKKVIPNIIHAATNAALALASNIPGLMTSIIVYAFLLNSLLLHGQSARRMFLSVSPFESETNELYLQRAGTIVTASLRGQFIIAIITAILSAALLIPLGLGSYFVFFVIIFTLLGMVPLGSGILMIPICIVAMLTEQFWPAFWVLLIYLGVVCNIDSLLRGRLIPKNAKLLPAITTLSTFCGIAYFGLFGVIYGPLIAILLTTTLDVYISYREKANLLTPPGSEVA